MGRGVQVGAYLPQWSQLFCPFLDIYNIKKKKITIKYNVTFFNISFNEMTAIFK
jgi:hypothetical protein